MGPNPPFNKRRLQKLHSTACLPSKDLSTSNDDSSPHNSSILACSANKNAEACTLIGFVSLVSILLLFITCKF
eukprot:c16480_g1_i1 orf=1-216(-)